MSKLLSTVPQLESYRSHLFPYSIGQRFPDGESGLQPIYILQKTRIIIFLFKKDLLYLLQLNTLNNANIKKYQH